MLDIICPMDFSNGFHLVGPGEAWLYLSNLVRPLRQDQVRVIIFGQGRTGSTVLESLICSTGHFEENGEVLNVQRYGQLSYPVQYVLGLAKWRSRVNFIFHVKIYQLTRNRRKPVDPGLFLRTLSKNGWKIIYIRRENVLKQVLSALGNPRETQDSHIQSAR